MTQAYKERHDYIVGELQKMPGVKVKAGDGTFYTFPSVEEVIEKSNLNNDIDFAEYLLTEAEIAIVPGSAFGSPGYLRISYATSMEKIQEAMQRMSTAIEKLLK
jgi:aspartate aminotransferase